ncbi:hypothetical protein SAMN06893096_10958 [Geodermatophilus pulveris]|uniref:Uncharacterized protein n=1 Tax=Geodermatophilus pulveris TaxID=1564159 RepID=A0A239HVK5_9ACTN|nr:hypothetical protein [Geodermatophilus pulveris]SNS85158.1 hypothetical protein SAMN06893096_10958 [Geodermatophilus pulveris]
MTAPRTDGPGEPPRTPSVSTAPPAAPRRWWSAVPHHLGRARTSTVVLALLFVGLYVLYLYVRPPDPAAGTVPADGTSVETPAQVVPVVPTESAAPTTSAPTTTAPRSTAAPPATSPGATAGTAGTAGTEPPGTAEPAPTTAPDGPTTAAPTTAAPTTAATATGAPGT